jgi:acetyltransferase
LSGEIMITTLAAEEVEAHLPDLIEVLQDSVQGGASVGFLPPLAASEAREYWQGVIGVLRAGSRVLLVARWPGEAIIGTVQLDLAMRANGLHRAEVSKLMVHSTAQRRGVARALMLALEAEARQLGRTTLVLDTRQGDPSERLYQGLGYQFSGTIPAYARSADGTLAATAFYYKLLDG